MKKALALVIGVALTAATTVGVLFLIRQWGPASRLAGLPPARSANPVDELAG